MKLQCQTYHYCIILLKILNNEIFYKILSYIYHEVINVHLTKKGLFSFYLELIVFIFNCDLK